MSLGTLIKLWAKKERLCICSICCISYFRCSFRGWTGATCGGHISKSLSLSYAWNVDSNLIQTGQGKNGRDCQIYSVLCLSMLTDRKRKGFCQPNFAFPPPLLLLNIWHSFLIDRCLAGQRRRLPAHWRKLPWSGTLVRLSLHLTPTTIKAVLMVPYQHVHYQMRIDDNVS